MTDAERLAEIAARCGRATREEGAE